MKLEDTIQNAEYTYIKLSKQLYNAIYTGDCYATALLTGELSWYSKMVFNTPKGASLMDINSLRLGIKALETISESYKEGEFNPYCNYPDVSLPIKFVQHYNDEHTKNQLKSLYYQVVAEMMPEINKKVQKLAGEKAEQIKLELAKLVKDIQD